MRFNAIIAHKCFVICTSPHRDERLTISRAFHSICPDCKYTKRHEQPGSQPDSQPPKRAALIKSLHGIRESERGDFVPPGRCDASAAIMMMFQYMHIICALSHKPLTGKHAHTHKRAPIHARSHSHTHFAAVSARARPFGCILS